MSHAQQLTLTLVAAIAAFAPNVARGQKDVASCKPVLDAIAKQYSVPSHAIGTETSPTAGAKVIPMEMISAGGQTYILMDGAWKRSPMTMAMMAKQQQDNVRDANAFACRRIRDESVGGVATVLYSMHSETEDLKSDGQVWIATSTGLPVRTELDSDTGDPDNTHTSLRYDYSNVRAPAGATAP
jgi:hypothetical protein